MKIVSVIPIKMQNERLPGKNTKKLGDRPLIEYIERTLLGVQELSKIYVYCSDTRIKPYLVKGIEFLKRPNYLDLPSSNFSQIFEQFALMVSADIYVYAHATAPFIKADTIRKCISKVKTGEFDSAFTAVGYQDYFWKGGGQNEPVNFDPSNVPRSQELPWIFRETSGVYVFTRQVFEQYHRRIGEHPYVCEVSEREAIDINYPEDFEKAQHYIGKSKAKRNVSILDCTLRDGGYITKFYFQDNAIRDMIANLQDAGLDYIEVGYLNKDTFTSNSTQYHSISAIRDFLPKTKKSIFLAMADVTQFYPENLEVCDGTSIDGIRVVFYKHQIEEAFALAKAVREKGYLLFMQPMVTIDYTIEEYSALITRIIELEPYAISIVDSFGYMMKEDVRRYFNILDDMLPAGVRVGFHSHNNMNLSFITAQDILEYETVRPLIIDASLYGMGRGAGNLQTELITNYYNCFVENRFQLSKILKMLGQYILPIYKERGWGYSPYYLLTGVYKCHPNYVAYLLEEHPWVPIDVFEKFLMTVPEEMKTKCRKAYVLQLWDRMMERNTNAGY